MNINQKSLLKECIKSIYGISMLTMLSCGGNHENEGIGHNHTDAEESVAEFGSEIVLSPEVAEKFGLEVETIVPGPFHEVIPVSGQIVDSPSSTWVVSAPTNGIVQYSPNVALGNEVGASSVIARISSKGLTGGNSNEVARVEMDAAKAEYERLKPLYDEHIISAQTFNEARANYEKAKATYSDNAASGIARTPRAGVITQVLVSEGQNVGVGDPLVVLSDAKELTLRADLPEKYYGVANQITTANIYLPHCNESHSLNDLNGRRTTNATATSQLRGYMPIYFTFNNDGHVMPGSFVKVYLQGAERSNVITVPKDAISEQQGQYFVYRQVDDECYEKIPVTLGQSDGYRVEIKSGLSEGQNIVVKGATAVRLAESTSVPEGHTH